MSRDVRVRDLFASEAPRAAQLVADAYPEELHPYIAYCQPQAHHRIHEVVSARSSSIWLAAIFGDNVVGVADFRVSETDVYLAHIAVDRDCRGRGIGSWLLKAGLQQFETKSMALDVFTWNTRAIEFYQSFGFVESGRKAWLARPVPRDDTSPQFSESQSAELGWYGSTRATLQLRGDQVTIGLPSAVAARVPSWRYLADETTIAAIRDQLPGVAEAFSVDPMEPKDLPEGCSLLDLAVEMRVAR